MSFQPSLKLTFSLLILLLLFLRLGFWQLERQDEKEQLFLQFESAPELTLEQALADNEKFALVEAYGRYDERRHILLDNKILNGRAGVHVLTPFTLRSGKSLLVNRGWLPLQPDRARLPDIAPLPGGRLIRGRLTEPVEGGPRIGGDDVLVRDRWPQLVTYFDADAIAEALDIDLQPWIIQLDAADDTGFDGRQWKAAVMGPEVHGAYAVQWFALAIATLIIWLTLGIRRGQTRKHEAE